MSFCRLWDWTEEEERKGGEKTHDSTSIVALSVSYRRLKTQQGVLTSRSAPLSILVLTVSKLFCSSGLDPAKSTSFVLLPSSALSSPSRPSSSIHPSEAPSPFHPSLQPPPAPLRVKEGDTATHDLKDDIPRPERLSFLLRPPSNPSLRHRRRHSRESVLGENIPLHRGRETWQQKVLTKRAESALSPLLKLEGG